MAARTQPVARSQSNEPRRRAAEHHAGLDRRDAAAIGLLLLAVAGMFWKELFAGQELFFRDVFNQSYPLAQFIHDVCRQGHIPYWNPLLNFGEPLVANPNSLFFYPDTLLIVLLPLDFAYNFHYVLSFMIAASGLYCLARRSNQSRWAALFAASAFVFSGPVLSLGSFYNEAACAAWIPWALLATDKALKERRIRPWLFLTVVFALQFLAGELFTLMATFILSLAYALWQAGSARRVFSIENRRIVGGFIAVAIGALAVSAVQFVPASYLLAGSRRGIQGLAYQHTTYWSLHPLILIETVLPHFFGNALEGYTTWSWVLNGRNNPYFPSIYLGFVPLFIAFVGWAHGHKNRKCRFVAGAAIAFLILVLGSYTPVFALVYLLFPPLSLVRFPIKLLIVFAMLAALLAGWGVDAFRSEASDWAKARSKIGVPLGVLLGLTVGAFLAAYVAPEIIRWPAEQILVHTNNLFLYGDATLKLRAAEIRSSLSFLVTMIKVYFPGLAGLLLGGIVWLYLMAQAPARGRKALPFVAAFGLIHLAAVNYSANPTVPETFYTYQPPILKQLPPSDPPYRIAYVERRTTSAASSAQTFLDFSSIPFVARLPMLAQTAFRDRLVLARGTMVTGREVIHNTDVDLSIPIDLFDFWIYERDQMPDPGRGDCLLGRANVRYEITPTRQRSRTLREAGRVFNGSAVPDYLYENLCSSPRAYVSDEAVYSTAPLQTLTMLSDPGFAPARQVILQSRSSTVRQGPDRGPLAPAGSVNISPESDSVLVLNAQMNRPGYVVLLDHYAPGWTAMEDGRPVAILRADLLFQAVHVGAGRHVIEFRYRSPGLKAGVIVTLAALGLIAAFAILDFRFAILD